MQGGKTFFSRSSTAPAAPRRPDQAVPVNGEPAETFEAAAKESQVPDEKPHSSPKSLDPVLLKAVASPAFVPRSLAPREETVPDPDPTLDVVSDEKQSDFMDENILGWFSDSILHLTINPDSLDTMLMRNQVENMQKVKGVDTLKQMVNMLIEQSIFEQNFRYSGAKMAAHFDQHHIEFPLESGLTNFRALFFNRLQKQYFDCCDLIKQTDNTDVVSEITGSAFFFGELLCCMKINGQLNRVIVSATLRFAHLLIANPSDAMIVCLARLMKLIGPVLDEELEQESSREIERLFENVKSLYKDVCLTGGSLQKETVAELKAAYILQTQKWNKNEPEKVYAADAPTNSFEEAAQQAKKAKASGRVSPPIDWSQYEAESGEPEQMPDETMNPEEYADFMSFLEAHTASSS